MLQKPLKPLKAGRSFTGEYYKDCVFFRTEQIELKKINLTQTCTESNCFMMKHLYTSQSWYKSISQKENSQTLPHPSYTPDLAPCDFFLFPCLKKSLSGHSVDSCSALRSAVFQCLVHIPKEDYRHAFEQCIQRLKKDVTAWGAHFEKMQAKKSVESV